MKVTFHHVNLCSTGVPAMDKFYREILDLETNPTLNANRDTSQGYDGAVAFLDAGDIQFHMATRDLDIAFKRGHAINPLEKGHIAFRTDDIEAFKKRLEDNGIPYADYGKWAMGGWHQIFFQDPEGNIIEVHQADA